MLQKFFNSSKTDKARKIVIKIFTISSVTIMAIIFYMSVNQFAVAHSTNDHELISEFTYEPHEGKKGLVKPKFRKQKQVKVLATKQVDEKLNEEERLIVVKPTPEVKSDWIDKFGFSNIGVVIPFTSDMLLGDAEHPYWKRVKKGSGSIVSPDGKDILLPQIIQQASRINVFVDHQKLEKQRPKKTKPTFDIMFRNKETLSVVRSNGFKVKN